MKAEPSRLIPLKSEACSKPTVELLIVEAPGR